MIPAMAHTGTRSQTLPFLNEAVPGCLECAISSFPFALPFGMNPEHGQSRKEMVFIIHS